jgi:hypothetical protein
MRKRCEVGAYGWMQDQCSDVPIPHLYGFGLTGIATCVYPLLFTLQTYI